MTHTPNASGLAHDSATGSATGSPATGSETFKHALRYTLEAGETVAWAERANGPLLPQTGIGYLNWLPTVLLPLLGGIVLALGVGSAQSTDRVLLAIAFAVVWLAISASIAFFTITRPRHMICVLTDRRFFSVDTRIPFLADSYWKRADSSAPLRAVLLQGSAASPVLVLRTIPFTREMKVVEFAGLDNARAVADLICKTLDCSSFKDSTQ